MSNAPNVPEPSGMVRTFDNENRTFTRPYSAKTIFFYKEGDVHFQGVRVPVSKARYRTMDSLLDDLTERVPLSFGVRKLFTPMGKRTVGNLDQLQHMGRYVCASNNVVGLKALDEASIERWRALSERKTTFQKNRAFSEEPSNNNSGRDRDRLRTLTKAMPNQPVPKQVVFILNSMPNRFHRILIRPSHLPLFNEILQEISESLQVPIVRLYTPTGKKVDTVQDILSGPNKYLACKKHERPNVPGVEETRFPPIATHRRNQSKEKRGITKTKSTVPALPKVNKTNSITRESTETSAKVSKRSRSQKAKKKPKPREPRPIPVKKMESDEDKAASKIQAGFRGMHTRNGLKQQDEAATKIQAGMRGHLTRKRLKRQKDGNETLEPFFDEQCAFRLQAFVKAMICWKRFVKIKTIKRRVASIDPDLAHNAATSIQANFRGYRHRKQFSQQKVLTRKMSLLDPSVANTAAVRIQASYRGYQTRKYYKREDNMFKLWTPVPETTDFESEEKAAIAIQSAYRGFKTRKSYKVDSSEPGTEETDQTIRDKDLTSVYAITIFTGNRWAADTDADLYVIVFGTSGDTGKIWLRQNDNEPKFQQNQMDTFEVESPYVGNLFRVTVGHDRAGYGAGIFLERVLVTDTEVDMAQYVFICNKWLDSGQVDAKLERTISALGFYDLSSMPEEQFEDDEAIDGMPSVTKGNWQLKMKNGEHKDSGTTSNIFVIAFGSYGKSERIEFTDTDLNKPGAQCQFDTEFGDIGELYKLRFELEPKGKRTNWLLHSVAMLDLDNGEKMNLQCNKWISSKRDKPSTKTDEIVQNFRELPIVRLGLEPLPVHIYSISIFPSTQSRFITKASHFKLQLTGEFGDSGFLTVPIGQNGNSKGGKKKKGAPNNMECLSAQLECVSLGRLASVSISIPVEAKAQEISAGFQVLQSIYERHNLSLSPAKEWITEKVTVRESEHAPYQFVFQNSKYIEADDPGTVVKQMSLTDMEGLTTINKQTTQHLPRETNHFVVIVKTGDHEDAGTKSTPYLLLYGDEGTSDVIALIDESQNFTAGSTCRFEIETPHVGRLFKVRVRLDASAEQPMWYLKKLIIQNVGTRDELRFPVEMWLEQTVDNPEVSVELPAIYPDVPPLPIVMYEVRVYTDSESDTLSSLDVFAQLFGQKGDTGKRFLRQTVQINQATFAPASVETFELEAVSVQNISKLLIGFDSISDNSKGWLLQKVEVLDSETGSLSVFQCDRLLAENKGDGKTEIELLPKED